MSIPEVAGSARRLSVNLQQSVVAIKARCLPGILGDNFTVSRDSRAPEFGGSRVLVGNASFEFAVDQGFTSNRRPFSHVALKSAEHRGGQLDDTPPVSYTHLTLPTTPYV